jgi:hypothetical protein
MGRSSRLLVSRQAGGDGALCMLRESIGDRWVPDDTVADVEPCRQTRVGQRCFVEAAICEQEHVGQDRVDKGLSRRSRNCPREVRNAVVDYSVNDERWVGVRRRSRGLRAATLIDGYVHQYRTLAHEAQVLAPDHVRSESSRSQYRSDQQVGIGDLELKIVIRRGDRPGSSGEHSLEVAQAVHVAIQKRGIAAEADGHARGVFPDDSSANDRDSGRADAGDTAGENAAATLLGR